jgi:hypothetical protein
MNMIEGILFIIGGFTVLPILILFILAEKIFQTIKNLIT